MYKFCGLLREHLFRVCNNLTLLQEVLLRSKAIISGVAIFALERIPLYISPLMDASKQNSSGSIATCIFDRTLLRDQPLWFKCLYFPKTVQQWWCRTHHVGLPPRARGKSTTGIYALTLMTPSVHGERRLLNLRRRKLLARVSLGPPSPRQWQSYGGSQPSRPIWTVEPVGGLAQQWI